MRSIRNKVYKKDICSIGMRKSLHRTVNAMCASYSGIQMKNAIVIETADMDDSGTSRKTDCSDNRKNGNQQQNFYNAGL